MGDVRLHPLLQTIRGMCTDGEPHEAIDRRLAEAVDRAYEFEADVQRMAIARGRAEGALEASEWPGVLAGWRERAEKAEARVAELEADVQRLRVPFVDDHSDHGPFDADELVRWAETYGHPEGWAKRAQAAHNRAENAEAEVRRAVEGRDAIHREIRTGARGPCSCSRPLQRVIE